MQILEKEFQLKIKQSVKNAKKIEIKIYFVWVKYTFKVHKNWEALSKDRNKHDK
jgi:hypothetical protein